MSVQPWRLSGWPIWWPSVCPALVAAWVDGPFGGRVSVQPWRLSGWPIWWLSVCPALAAEWMAHLVAECLSSLGGWVNAHLVAKRLSSLGGWVDGPFGG